jgi:hypothetical protein
VCYLLRGTTDVEDRPDVSLFVNGATSLLRRVSRLIKLWVPGQRIDQEGCRRDRREQHHRRSEEFALPPWIAVRKETRQAHRTSCENAVCSRRGGFCISSDFLVEDERSV